MKFSSDSLQICYIDSLYYTHQCVNDFKLIYFLIFCIFRCFFQCFYLEKFSLRKNVKVSDEVKFSMKFSSDSLQICYIDSLYHTHQYVNDFKLIFFLIFCIFKCFFSVFTLKNLAWEKMLRFLIKSSFLWSSHQIHFKFATLIHCIIPINAWMISGWYFYYFLHF